MIKELTQENITQELNNHKTALIYFYSTSCGPCKKLILILTELSNHTNNTFLMGKVDVEINPKLTQEYNIKSLPTIHIFKNNSIQETLIGMQTISTLKKTLLDLQI